MKSKLLLKELCSNSSLAENGTVVTMLDTDCDTLAHLNKWSEITFGETVNQIYRINLDVEEGEYLAFYGDADIPITMPDIIIIREGNMCPIILYYLG